MSGLGHGRFSVTPSGPAGTYELTVRASHRSQWLEYDVNWTTTVAGSEAC